MADTSRISPTAHYTGYVWIRNGLAPSQWTIPGGRRLFWVAQPILWFGSLFVGGINLERMLLSRHRVLDQILTDAIEAGRVTQVLEIAAGMSGRGLRFATKYPELVYVEGDLPGMAKRKAAALADSGLQRANQHVVALDALTDEGALCLEEATRDVLDPSQPTAVITEGLINYFDTPTVQGLWQRVSTFLGRRGGGVYLCDLRLDDSATAFAAVRFFLAALSVVAKGRVHTHFGGVSEAATALSHAGFAEGRLRDATEFPQLDVHLGRRGEVIHLVEASR